jgi:hypothetical protein
MPARSFRSCGVATLATLAMAACAPTAVPRSNDDYAALLRVPSLTPTSRVIDAARIARSGSQTALDAVRAFVPHRRLRDTGPVTALGARAESMARGTLRVIVDRHPITDVEELRMIPAREVIAIHVLSAPDAMTLFGPSYDGGAIVIQTRASLRPL